ncbi:phosphatidylinositol-binding clathrin assembly protein LAP-like [Paramacrobiotus metropolitanus]|uniref:phosphatidylinositol-binding clathrin assembly protein LAP-like n=1 Tax=Paramacrobiotus metropolitanus TaxID=2943436 RepID=UPI002445EFE1|nr:phosphatidylinositol-binding clathrin assembly protein LAP-like [Paramacrobiotus metropolitanus]
MNMNAGGQTIADRINAARFGLAGHMLAKAVCKATTEEPIGPKKKHLDYLLHCTEEPNVSIPQLANLLLDRLQHNNWIVVYKALVSIHHLMLYGNERFIQYLASANTSFSLNSFLDNKSGVQGYDMSTYIRRYSKYLNQKALSYRTVAFDFCKVKRGKDDGVLRKMSAEKLLKTLPIIQDQMDALLEFDCSPNELTNAVISSCFVLLFRDLIRLFACYNDGIINMLEKYFDMNKKQCRDALDIYKKFLVRMDKVAGFLKVAENVGIPKGEIPDLTKAPASLLDALEQHLENLEGGKKPVTPPGGGVPGSGSIHTGLMSLSATEHSLNEVDQNERQRAILEEQQAMEEIRKKREQQAQQLGNASAGVSGTPVSLPKAPSGPGSPSNGVVPPAAAPSQPAAASKSDLFDLLDLDMSAGGAPNAASTTTQPNYGALSDFVMSASYGVQPNMAAQNNMAFGGPARPPQGFFPAQGMAPAGGSNPFASPTQAYPPPGMGQMQSPMGANPFAMSANGYQSAPGMAGGGMGYGTPGKMPVSSPMGQPQAPGGGGFDADFSVFGGGQAAAAANNPFASTPTKPTAAAGPGQSKLIQSNVDTSLANLAANLNLGSLGAYGVRPSSVTGTPQQAQQGQAPFGGAQRMPMAQSTMSPVNSGVFGGQMPAQQQQQQYGGNVNSGATPWNNPFMSPTQPSPTRQPAAAASDDPFASLI